MFGFWKKRREDELPGVTFERAQEYFVICRKFPDVIPATGSSVCSLASEIAKPITTCFNEAIFEDVLIRRFAIDKRFVTGWTKPNALALWYSLGIISLTRCSMLESWSEALTVDLGAQVYDATVEFLWLHWSVSDVLRQTVTAFMGTNIGRITKSLENSLNGWARTIWFLRYAARMRGLNPPWEIMDSEVQAKGGDALTRAAIDGDLELIEALCKFDDLASGAVMKLIGAPSPDLAIPTAVRRKAE